MRLMRTINYEKIYELEEMIPLQKTHLGQFVVSLLLAWGGIWFSDWQTGFLIGALCAFFPLAKEFFVDQLNSVLLTNEYIQIRKGINPNPQTIVLKDIKKVRLIDQESKNSKKGKKHKKDFSFHNLDQFDYSEDAHCLIETKDGRKFVIRSHYFPMGEFSKFLNLLQKTYQNEEKKFVSVKKNEVSPYSNPFLNPAPITNENDETSRVTQENLQYMQEDLQLKREFVQNMFDAYISIYRQRDDLDLARIRNARVIYHHLRADGRNVYFLADDYLPNLAEDNIEIGKNLIEAAHNNIQLIELRLKYRRKLAEELEKLRFQEANRRRLRDLADKLKNLQEKNAGKSLDQSLNPTENIDSRVIMEIEAISQKVRNTEDLHNAIMLKEYIALFRDL